MIATTRRSLVAVALMPVLATATAALTLAPVAGAAEGGEEGGTSAAPIHYEKESLSEFDSQLAGHQIRSVTINRLIGSLRITLVDGRHVLVHYKSKEGPHVRAALTAARVPVTVLSAAQAKTEQRKQPVHHKLRYIVAAVVIVVIVAVVGFFLYRRRRRQSEE